VSLRAEIRAEAERKIARARRNGDYDLARKLYAEQMRRDYGPREAGLHVWSRIAAEGLTFGLKALNRGVSREVLTRSIKRKRGGRGGR
jgi:hypothetical protein